MGGWFFIFGVVLFFMGHIGWAMLAMALAWLAAANS